MEALNYDVPPPNLLGGIGQGFGLGMGIQQAQAAQAQQQIALQQQQRQQQVIGALMSNPNPTGDDYAAATLAVPTLREHFKQAWEMHDGAQQKTLLGQVGQVYAALAGGQPEVASTLLNQQADALTNSGGPKDRIQAARSLANVVVAHPEFARRLVGMQLASIPGGDKVLTNWAAMGKEDREQAAAPADLLKKQADASKAATEAGVATATAPAAVEKAGLDNKKAAADIENQKAQQRIAELNVQIAQANSETQRGQLVLERDKLVATQGEKAKTEASDAQNQLDTLQQSLGTLERIRKHPAIEGVGRLPDKLAGFVPGTERKDFEALLDTLKSQQFLASVSQMKGLGALTEAEGKKLTDAVGSLNPDQSVGAFKNTIGVIEANLRKAQAKLVAAGKLPTAGGAFVMTHPTYGKVTDGDVNRLLTKFPGATREQVLEYLRQSGGK